MTFDSRNDTLGNLVIYVIVGVVAIGVMNLFDLPASVSAFLYVVIGFLALMGLAGLVDGLMNRLRERKAARLAARQSGQLPNGEAEDGHAGNDIDRTHKAGTHSAAQPTGAGGEDHPPRG